MPTTTPGNIQPVLPTAPRVNPGEQTDKPISPPFIASTPRVVVSTPDSSIPVSQATFAGPYLVPDTRRITVGSGDSKTPGPKPNTPEPVVPITPGGPPITPGPGQNPTQTIAYTTNGPYLEPGVRPVTPVAAPTYLAPGVTQGKGAVETVGALQASGKK